MRAGTEYHKNQMLWMAAMLLCLVLASSWMLSGLSARFTTGASGEDQARVAVFQVTESTTMSHSFAITMYPGSGETEDSRQTFGVTIENKSEVALKYLISMELEGNLPLTVQASGKEEGTPPLTAGEDAMTWSAEAAANAGSTAAYTFYPVWSEEDNSYRYSEGVESIRVTVTAVQED